MGAAQCSCRNEARTARDIELRERLDAQRAREEEMSRSMARQSQAMARVWERHRKEEEQTQCEQSRESSIAETRDKAKQKEQERKRRRDRLSSRWVLQKQLLFNVSFVLALVAVLTAEVFRLNDTLRRCSYVLLLALVTYLFRYLQDTNETFPREELRDLIQSELEQDTTTRTEPNGNSRDHSTPQMERKRSSLESGATAFPLTDAAHKTDPKVTPVEVKPAPVSSTNSPLARKIVATPRKPSRSTTSTGRGELETVVESNVAECGNGSDGPLSSEQFEMVRTLHQALRDEFEALSQEQPAEKDFCDLETCRRYLVARQWNFKKAEAQLRSTIAWRAKTKPGMKEFWESPKPLEDPYSLAMRVVGFDKDERPVCYSCFYESHDRFDADSNIAHMLLLMESCCRLIQKRRQMGLNRRADQRQWVWVIDFDGFSLRDQNPRTGSLVAKLMQHYPEMLRQVILLNAPWLFSATWSIISGLVDDRVRQKVLFLKGSLDKISPQLTSALGVEMGDWVVKETQDIREKRALAKQGMRRKYWDLPEVQGAHDARGVHSYINSTFYIKTPGDHHRELTSNAPP